jgi:DNA-binding transcriptional MerR regulator
VSDELISIGRFGRATGLSPRQLRYYHELGILAPATVDPHSGYRYYREAQRATAELIVLLRSVDMPLSDIESMIADRSPTNVRRVFDRLRVQLEQRLAHAEDLIARLDTLEETTMSATPTTTHEPPVFHFEAFTPDGQAALLAAHKVAGDLQANEIGPEHMLAGLAAGGTGHAHHALVAAGLAQERILGALPQGSGAGNALPNADLRGLVTRAVAMSGADTETMTPAVSAAELLRATLSSEAGVGPVLKSLGVTAAEILAHLA